MSAGGDDWISERLRADGAHFRVGVLLQELFEFFFFEVFGSLLGLLLLLFLPLFLEFPARLVIAAVVDVDAAVTEGAVACVVVVLAEGGVVVESAAELDVGWFPDDLVLGVGVWDDGVLGQRVLRVNVRQCLRRPQLLDRLNHRVLRLHEFRFLLHLHHVSVHILISLKACKE